MSCFNYFNVFGNNNNDFIGEDHIFSEQMMYDFNKKSETAGFNEDFINEIYDMPKIIFVQNVLDNTLPELDKLPVPENAKFPVPISLETNTLVRSLSEVPDTFHEWLYQFRFMLQYFTTEEMFHIFHLYDFAYGLSEPNAWIDNSLEEMCAVKIDESILENEDVEFKFNLDWDIEKGTFYSSRSPRLSLRLPEEVGMIIDDPNEITPTNKL